MQRAGIAGVFDDGLGTGADLIVGGVFQHAGGVHVDNIARWHGLGQHWMDVGGHYGMVVGLNNPVFALWVFDDGTGGGDELYAGGVFTFCTTSGQPVSRIARLDLQNLMWSPLAAGVNQAVFALAEYDDGTGSALYAAGGFTAAGLQPAKRIAAWDGCPPPPPPGCGTCPISVVHENEPCGTHINDFCGQTGCTGHCGGQSTAGCWCDNQCCTFGDCCLDQHLVCNECTWGPTPIACGDTVCGSLWVNVDGTVDFDRYAIEITSFMTSLEIEIESDVAITVWVDNGECPGDPDHEVYGGFLDISECTTEVHTAAIPAPGVYYINIQAAGTPHVCPDESLYTFEVTCPTVGPVNALCTNATVLIILPPPPPLAGGDGLHMLSVEFDNIGAETDGPGEADCSFTGVDDSDVWFEFTATHTGEHLMTIEPTGGQPDRMLALYDGGCPQEGHPLMMCTQALGGAGRCVNVSMAEGDIAVIRVGTPGGDAGQGESRLTIDACPADLNGDGVVDVSDLLILLGAWGMCPDAGMCVGDFNCDGVVDVSDLLIMLGAWGPCL